MRRREFITLLGGAATAWPLAARAQQDGRVRRVGILFGGSENDPGSVAQRTALREGLAKLGWVEGRNLRIDLRFGAGDAKLIRIHATELVNLAPDAIVTSSGLAAKSVQQATQTIPIVFSAAGDAVANGLVRNIARPESNLTGFSGSEPAIAGKRLALLKEAVPQLTRVAVVFNPDITLTGPSYLASAEAAAPALSVQVVAMPVRDAVDVVRAIDAYAAAPNGGLLILPPPPTRPIFDAILRLTTQHRIPAIYSNQPIGAAGGLLVYSSDNTEQSGRAAAYVDRILRGAKVSELPVQFPTKYDLIVNLKAAKAIGLKIPEVFLLRADEILE